MSILFMGLLATQADDELSPAMAEVELQLAEVTATAIDRLWARAARDNAPESRLSDRDWDVCTEKLQEKVDADFVSDVADVGLSDTELGGRLRAMWGQIVADRVGR